MIPRDKLMHLAMGAAACAVLFALHHMPLSAAVLVGCAALGVFYEAQQWYRKEGTPDVWDAAATTLPGLLVYLILEAPKWIR